MIRVNDDDILLSQSEFEAENRLTAAAPDLLAACKAAQHYIANVLAEEWKRCGSQDIQSPTLADLTKAIAKAEGK